MKFLVTSFCLNQVFVIEARLKQVSCYSLSKGFLCHLTSFKPHICFGSDSSFEFVHTMRCTGYIFAAMLTHLPSFTLPVHILSTRSPSLSPSPSLSLTRENGKMDSMNDPDRPGARVNISTNCDAFLPVPHLDLVLDTVLQIQRWNQWSAKHEMPNLHNDTRLEEGFCGRRSRQFTFYTNSVRLAQTRNRLRFHPPHAEVRSRPCMVERFRINDTKLR